MVQGLGKEQDHTVRWPWAPKPAITPTVLGLPAGSSLELGLAGASRSPVLPGNSLHQSRLGHVHHGRAGGRPPGRLKGDVFFAIHLVFCFVSFLFLFFKTLGSCKQVFPNGPSSQGGRSLTESELSSSSTSFVLEIRSPDTAQITGRLTRQ